MNRIEDSRSVIVRTTGFALATLLLTTVHHVYGAYVYGTPWRLHVGFVAGFSAVAIVASLLAAQRESHDASSRLAFWAFVAVVLIVPVLLIGLVEGGYNHVLKNAFYFGGAPMALVNRLFPPPTYELPDDVFFEVTGMMQVVPGALTGWFLYRLLRVRFSGASRRARQADTQVVNA